MKTRRVAMTCAAVVVAGMLGSLGSATLPADNPSQISGSIDRYQVYLNGKGEPEYLLDLTSGEVFKRFGLSWSSEVRGREKGRYQLILGAKGELTYLTNVSTGEVYKKFGPSWSVEIHAVKQTLAAP